MHFGIYRVFFELYEIREGTLQLYNSMSPDLSTIGFSDSINVHFVLASAFNMFDQYTRKESDFNG